MSNLVEHAKQEFLRMGYDPIGTNHDMNDLIQRNIIELLEVFSNQGHSGISAPYAVNVFSKLAKFNILAPLTKEELEDENNWQDLMDEGFADQCKLLSSVFRKEAGHSKYYFVEAIVFTDVENGCSYTGKVEDITSRQNIKLPFIPKTFYIDVKDGKIVDKSQLKPIADYYDVDENFKEVMLCQS